MAEPPPISHPAHVTHERVLRDHVDRTWSNSIVGALQHYIALPALSPAFDPAWESHGHLRQAVEFVAGWCRDRSIPTADVEIHEQPGRTPVIIIEIDASDGSGPGSPAVLLYGHVDKQPEMVGWRDGLGPWTPVLDGERLYGRGGADDGYSAFAALAAVEALRAAGGDHGRLVVIIEASEESGSPDLSAHIEALADRIGDVDLVIALDSGCATYDRLWTTTSLRGLVGGTLRIDILDNGVHSGSAGGVVPSSFRIARMLLSRIEDEATGEIRLPELHVEIPPERRMQAVATAAELGAPWAMAGYPFVDGARPIGDDAAEQLLARTWRASLAVVGADGLPPTAVAGNVLRPSTALALALRIPPTADPTKALAALSDALTREPPYGARIAFDGHVGPGWNAPETAAWLESALDRVGAAAFDGRAPRAMGEGGTIPFMGMLGERFPSAQFVVTGVLGPDSNAHGPNEFLHLGMARKLTVAIAMLLGEHRRHQCR